MEVKHLSKTAINLDNNTLDNCIIYRKNGIMEVINPPKYGEVTLKFQDDTLTLISKNELTKLKKV